MSVTVGQAFEALGYALKSDETVCVATLKRGSMTFQSLHHISDEPIGANRYISSGTFDWKTDWKAKGARSARNVRRVMFLPFDFDFKDFLNIDKDDVLDLSNDELKGYIPLLQKTVEGVFDQIGLPIHRLDYTGHGLAAHIQLPPHPPADVPVFKELHAGIVRRINDVYGGIIADRQVSDAGTRILRLIPCLNIATYSDKRGNVDALPRQTENLFRRDGLVTMAMLRVASDAIAFTPRQFNVPEVGDMLSTDDILDIVEHYKPYNTTGQRHYLSLGIAGQLANAKVPENQALRIIEQIHSDDRKPWDRQKSVRDTYQKIRNGQKIAGFDILKDLIPEETIDDVTEILKAARRAVGPSLRLSSLAIENGQELDDKNRPIRFEEYPEPPLGAFYGWFAKYVDLMHPTTEATKGFHLGAVLNVAGAIVARRIGARYASEILYPGQYTLLVGPTGSSRKGTTMKRAHRLPIYQIPGKGHLDNPFTVLRDLGSGPALVKTLKEHPNTLIVFEEATALFSNIQRKGGEQLLDRLIEAWDTPDFLQDNVKVNPYVARNFFLSILAGTQPGRLEDAITANEIDSGLANRLCIFFGVRREMKARAPHLDEAAAAMLYREFHDAVRSYPEGTVLEFDDDANESWDDWYTSHSSYKGSEDELAMRIRHPEHALKWSLLFAISDRADAISRDHLEAAFHVLDWMWNGIKRRLGTWGVSIDKKIEELVFQVLREQGPMKRRDLQMKTSRKKWSGREFAAVFRAMLENGHVVADRDGYVALADMVERAQAAEQRKQSDRKAA